jgi:hypothetical protein
VLFILSMPVQSAQQTSSVWRSASFERVNICFQVFIVFLALFVSSAFHFNCLSCSIRVANWVFYVRLLAMDTFANIGKM